MYLHHLTLSTGHLARTAREDVAPEVTALLAPWLVGLVQTGKVAPLPASSLSAYSAQALVQDGALVVTVYAPTGPHAPGKPHAGPGTPLVTLGVAQRSRQAAGLWDALTGAFPARAGLQMPSTPWVAVATHPAMLAHRDAVEWLGDFERCIAWSWITRNPSLESAP